jgi:hypothetical protein
MPDEDQAGGETRRRSLLALALRALDEANTLWNYPATRARPRQLSTSPRFRENNLWLALEEAAVQLASSNASPVELVTWPELPPDGGGITLFEGRLRELVQRLQEQPKRPDFAAAFGARPRPNQAFWTLSALWAGWLWGREASGHSRACCAAALRLGLAHHCPAGCLPGH